MAITLGNTSNAGNPGAVTTYNWLHTCAADTTLLVVVITGSDSAIATDFPVTGVTYNGAALTKAREFISGLGTGVSVWYKINPTTGSALSIAVTHTGKVTDTTGYGVDLKGTNTSSPYDNYIEGNYDADLPVTVNPAATGSIGIGGLSSNHTDPANVSVTTGTQIAEIDLGPISSCAYAFESGGTATIVWTQGSGYGGSAVVCTFKVATGDISKALTGVYATG